MVAVCDVKECTKMTGFLRDASVRRHEGKSAVDVLVAAKTAGEPKVVTMNYCPFCGTRIVSSILHKLEPRSR